jgi:hypothetical protein
MPGPEKEIMKIWAVSQGEDGEHEGHLVLTDQRICFYPTRWGGLARGQILWWAHHGAVAHLEQWGTGIFTKGNMLTVSVRHNHYDTRVYSHTVRGAGSSAIAWFMNTFYTVANRRG